MRMTRIWICKGTRTIVPAPAFRIPGPGRAQLLMRVLATVVAAALLNGCATDPARPGSKLSGPVRAVERLDLLLTSVAIDLDGQPGGDGFGARVYASNRKSASGVVIAAGRLEIVMYDGVVGPEELKSAVPLRTWSYSEVELKPYAQKTSIGTGYRFALAWGEKKPRAERVTVVARHIASDGTTVLSAPGSIPLAVK